MKCYKRLIVAVVLCVSLPMLVLAQTTPQLDDVEAQLADFLQQHLPDASVQSEVLKIQVENLPVANKLQLLQLLYQLQLLKRTEINASLSPLAQRMNQLSAIVDAKKYTQQTATWLQAYKSQTTKPEVIQADLGPVVSKAIIVGIPIIHFIGYTMDVSKKAEQQRMAVRILKEAGEGGIASYAENNMSLLELERALPSSPYHGLSAVTAKAFASFQNAAAEAATLLAQQATYANQLTGVWLDIEKLANAGGLRSIGYYEQYAKMIQRLYNEVEQGQNGSVWVWLQMRAQREIALLPRILELEKVGDHAGVASIARLGQSLYDLVERDSQKLSTDLTTWLRRTQTKDYAQIASQTLEGEVSQLLARVNTTLPYEGNQLNPLQASFKSLSRIVQGRKSIFADMRLHLPAIGLEIGIGYLVWQWLNDANDEKSASLETSTAAQIVSYRAMLQNESRKSVMDDAVLENQLQQLRSQLMKSGETVPTSFDWLQLLQEQLQ